MKEYKLRQGLNCEAGDKLLFTDSNIVECLNTKEAYKKAVGYLTKYKIHTEKFKELIDYVAQYDNLLKDYIIPFNVYVESDRYGVNIGYKFNLTGYVIKKGIFKFLQNDFLNHHFDNYEVEYKNIYRIDNFGKQKNNKYKVYNYETDEFEFEKFDIMTSIAYRLSDNKKYVIINNKFNSIILKERIVKKTNDLHKIVLLLNIFFQTKCITDRDLWKGQIDTLYNKILNVDYETELNQMKQFDNNRKKRLRCEVYEK